MRNLRNTRISTWVLSAFFVATLTTYLLVRPPPVAGQGGAPAGSATPRPTVLHAPGRTTSRSTRTVPSASSTVSPSAGSSASSPAASPPSATSPRTTPSTGVRTGLASPAATVTLGGPSPSP